MKDKVKKWYNKIVRKKEPKVETNETVRRNTLEKEKEEATKAGKPWVAVIDTQVNPKDIKNGFFELDWNKYFIQELIQNGYGTEQDPEEEIVDRWFKDIVYNMLSEEGMDTDRGAGYINVKPLSDDKSEVS